MSAGTGWNGPLELRSSLSLWGQLKEAVVPVITYWVWVVFSLLVFTVAVLGSGSNSGDDVLFLAAFVFATLGGVGVGQVCAFLRVRTWVLVALGAIMWTIFFVFLAAGGSAILGNEVIAAFVISILFLGPIAMTGGLWSLETNRALWSTWLPMVFTVGGVAVWADEHGAIGAWEAGQKWAVWDLVTLAMFVPSVCLFMLYLVTRETHRLAMWKRGPTSPLMPSVQERGVSRPRITLLGLLALGGLAIAVAGTSAVIAPFLWRTHVPDDCEDGSGICTDGGQGENQAAAGDRKGSPGDGSGEQEGNGIPKEMQEMMEKMGEAAKEAGGTLCSVLSVAILAAIGALLAYRPVKRLLVVRHLRDPLWRVPPTHRIEQCWRLVEIALGDAGVEPIPGEDAAGLARRAGPVLSKLSPVEVHGLDDVAEVADRVRFGLGVGPDDVAVMERFSKWVLDTVWERLDDKAQMGAMYRGI